jgi:hypothetical protein
VTKSTFKTLWFTGGGLVATWLAVNPSPTTPHPLPLAATPRPGVVREVTLDDLNFLEARLRQHSGNGPLRPSARNPFRFGKVVAPEAPHPLAVTPAAAASTPRPQPSLNLSGIAERNTPEGRKRTAIIAGDGQLYLVTEGELVAGRYHVVTIDSDAVTLRDDDGTDTRLVLR